MDNTRIRIQLNGHEIYKHNAIQLAFVDGILAYLPKHLRVTERGMQLRIG